MDHESHKEYGFPLFKKILVLSTLYQITVKAWSCGQTLQTLRLSSMGALVTAVLLPLYIGCDV